MCPIITRNYYCFESPYLFTAFLNPIFVSVGFSYLSQLLSRTIYFIQKSEEIEVSTFRSAFQNLKCDLQNGFIFVLQVAWVRAEDQTILTLHSRVVTHNSRISVTHDSLHTWQLHIRQVKEADRGCYMCQINTSVMRIQEGCVDVHGKLQVNQHLKFR